MIQKNIFNKVEKDPTKHESISVEEKLCEDEKIENKWENECEGILFYAKTMHEKLKDNWQQEYLAASTNRKIMSKIDYFLKNMNQIKMNYEFVFICWGAFNYGQYQTMKAINDDIEDEIANFYSQDANQIKIQTFWRETVKNIYLDVVQNMKIKYGMLLEEAGQNIQDPKQKILCENFLQNPDLFKEERYQYEYMLLKRGHLQEGPKEIMKKFKKRIELLSVDPNSKNINNKNKLINSNL